MGWDRVIDQMGIVVTLVLEVQEGVNMTAWQVRQISLTKRI